MNMSRLAPIVVALAVASQAARAQGAMSACGSLPDSTARQVIKAFSGVRVCMLAAKLESSDDFPRDWAAKARTLVLETQRDGDNRRAAISGSSITWTVNGQPATIDSLAEAWQTAVVDYLDAAFQADQLRRQSDDLRAEIDSLPQRIAAAKIRIAYLEQRDQQLNVLILNAGNRERQIRQQISRLQAARGSAQSRASTARRMAASSRDAGARQSYESQAAAADMEVMQLSDAIDRAESEITANSGRAVASAQEELRSLQPRHNISLLKLQLANYESISPEDVERQIRELDAPQRLPVLDAQVEKTRLALLAVLEARGKAPSR